MHSSVGSVCVAPFKAQVVAAVYCLSLHEASYHAEVYSMCHHGHRSVPYRYRCGHYICPAACALYCFVVGLPYGNFVHRVRSARHVTLNALVPVTC